MKLKEYVENLMEIINKNPEYKELNVVYSSDSEGNSFHEVYFLPHIGNFFDGEFKFEEDNANAICIN